MEQEPVEDDFRSPNVVVTTPFEQADAEIQIEMARRMRQVVSGQEGAA